MTTQSYVLEGERERKGNINVNEKCTNPEHLLGTVKILHVGLC